MSCPGVAAGWLEGELIMDDLERLTSAPATGIRSCWICGIRLPVERMVADGGSACADVRFYCRDMRACTQRWTRQPADPADLGRGAAGAREPHLTSSDIPSPRW
jgi:hypothetical protein